MMDHKEMCYNWVEERKEEAEDGWWILDGSDAYERVQGPFDTEEEVDDILWPRALNEAHEKYLP